MNTDAPSFDMSTIRQALSGFSTSLVADSLKAHGAARLVMREVKARTQLAQPVFGPARTLRFLPTRADVKPRSSNLRMQLIDGCKPGEILVFDSACSPQASVFGDMVAVRAHHTGAIAVVTDGAIRDVDAISATGIAPFSAHIAPAPSAAPAMAWEADVAIQCGGVLVQPGDWVFGDSDGVIVIPGPLLETVVHNGNSLTQKEAFSRALLERGHTLADSFPLPETMQPFFERYLRDGTLPSADEVSRHKRA